VSLREGELVRELAADCGEYLVGMADLSVPTRESALADPDSALPNDTAGNKAPFSITMGRVRLDIGRDESHSLPIVTESGVVLPLEEAACLEDLAASRFAIIFSRFLSPTRFLHSTHLQLCEQYADTRKHSQYFLRHDSFLHLHPFSDWFDGTRDRNAFGFRMTMVSIAMLRSRGKCIEFLHSLQLQRGEQ
jgi:hypothetical protein